MFVVCLQKVVFGFLRARQKINSEKQKYNHTKNRQMKSPKRLFRKNPSKFPLLVFVQKLASQFSLRLTSLCTAGTSAGLPAQQRPLTPQLAHGQRTARGHRVISPFILTVGELGPADCFLHPLQFWQRLSASEMKEQRESSSK